MGFLKFFAASAFKLSVLFASVLFWFFVIRKIWIGGFSYVGMPRIGDITQTWPLLLSSWFLGWKRKESQFVTFVTAFFVAGYAGWQLWPDLQWSQKTLSHYSLQEWLVNAPIINMLVFALTILAAVLTVIFTSENAIKRVLEWKNGGFKKMKISKSTVFGKSRLTTEKELRAITKKAESSENAIILGRFKSKKNNRAELIKWDLEAHIVTTAATRSGKGVGLIVPNILFYKGPVVVFDPKGENAFICARHRERKRKVITIDPFSLCKSFDSEYKPEMGSYNILDFIEEGTVEADITVLLEVLFVPSNKGDDETDHWINSAKSYIGGLIHYAYCLRDSFPERGSLKYVYELLKIADPDVEESHWNAMLKYGGLAEAGASHILSAPEKERGSILSTARATMKWLAIPQLANAVSKSNFSLDDLNNNKIDLFVCIPGLRIKMSKILIRIFTSLPLSNTMRRPVKKRILFFIDEAPMLGKMEPVLEAFRIISGLKSSIWLFTQTLADLEATYGKSETVSMLGNAEAVTAFGLGKTNPEMAEWISKSAGTMTIEQVSINESSGDSSRFTDILKQKSDNKGKNIQEAERKILTPDDIGNMHKMRMIILPRSDQMKHVSIIDKVNYFDPDVAEFDIVDENGVKRRIYDKNPYFEAA